MDALHISQDCRSFHFGNGPELYVTLCIKGKFKDLGHISSLRKRRELVNEVAKAYLHYTPRADCEEFLIDLTHPYSAEVNGNALENGAEICSLVQKLFQFHLTPPLAVPGMQNGHNHCFAISLIHLLFERFGDRLDRNRPDPSYATDGNPSHLFLHHLGILRQRYLAIVQGRERGPIPAVLVRNFLQTADLLDAASSHAPERQRVWSDTQRGHDPLELYNFLSNTISTLEGGTELIPLQPPEQRGFPFLIISPPQEGELDIGAFLGKLTNEPIHIPLYINRPSSDTNPLTIPLEVEINHKRYLLTAAMSYRPGHYSTYLLRSGRWILADDTRIEETSNHTTAIPLNLRRQARFLQYKRLTS